ncbi:MAG: hypothetical protein ACKO2P_00395 [Planctomycetota bacterium]
MFDSRPLPRLSLIGLLLLLQAGCTTSSLRNLFSWNRRSEFHTLEELESQSGKKSAEPAKTASWNPFGRSAATPADSTPGSSAPSPEKQPPQPGSPVAEAADQKSAADPFLQDEALSSKSTRSRIQRTAAVISTPEDSEVTETTNPGDVAEALIVAGGKAQKPKQTPPQKSAPSSLEARKLAELDALLEGRELAAARRVGSEASVKVNQTEETLRRTRATASSRARKAADTLDQSAVTARKTLEDTLAFDDSPADEHALADETVDDSSDRAEPLIRNPPALPAVAASRQRPPAAQDAVSGDSDDERPLDNPEMAEATSVADADALFGSLQSSARQGVRATDPETSHFSWKSSATTTSRHSAAASGPPLRLAGMHRETPAGDTEDGRDQTPVESTSSPDFDEQPISEGTHHAPTSGNTFKDAGSRAAGAFNPAPAPVHSAHSIAQASAAVAGEGSEEETAVADSADSFAARAEVSRAGLLAGLSARTWGLVAAGGIVVCLLFLPAKRRVLLRPTATGHA